MKRMLLNLMLVFSLLASVDARAQQTFDYYLLDLSWSPQYCNSKNNSDQTQCGPDKSFGFVVHGLWPQREIGKWPQNCSTEQVSASQINTMLDIMPSQQLVQHEWTKHGTCSGLGVVGYFQAVRESFESLRIPTAYQKPTKPLVVRREDFVAEFLAANPGLEANMIALKCSKGAVQELGICLDKDARTPRACGQLNFKCKSEEIRFDAKR
ncbi:MAG: ribonuclease T2 [Cystobacter sp.]